MIHAANSETEYDAAGTVVISGGWRIPEPYTSTSAFRVGDKLKIAWNGSDGLPKEVGYGGTTATVIKVNRKRLVVRTPVWSDPLSIQVSTVLEIVARI